MEMRKLLYILPVVVLALFWLFWPETDEDKKLKSMKDQARRAALAANPQSGEHREFLEQNKKLFVEENMYTFSQIMEMARTGRLLLVAELWRLRTKCGVGSDGSDKDGAAPPQMNFDECNIRIENFLRQQYPPPDNEKMVSLFRGYLRYEDAMRRFNLPDNTPIAERLELIKKKRREFFSEADAQLIFGFEETRSSTQESLNEFVKSSAGMPAEQRVKKFYEMRKNMLGDYNAAVNETEPAYTRYETEVMLRADEMERNKNSGAQTQALREKYFGAEGAKRMAQVDREIQQERQKIAEYEAAAQKLARDTANLSEAERNAKLAELRVGILGKEEADAYERRMQYEEYLRTNHLK